MVKALKTFPILIFIGVLSVGYLWPSFPVFMLGAVVVVLSWLLHAQADMVNDLFREREQMTEQLEKQNDVIRKQLGVNGYNYK